MGTSRIVGWFARILVAVTVAAAILASGLGLTYLGASTILKASQHDGLPDIDLRPLAHRSEIVAADGSLLSALFEEDRVPVELARVPQVLVDAVVAVEDSAFYEHRGLSIRGLARAIKTNVVEGEVDQGGSTITQQLVKNGILDDEKSLDRKAREAVLAVHMEKELSKDQILETYLNTVYFGQGAYGVEAAARRFFGKSVEEISLSEAALLAGMIASPEAYDPLRHPEAARSRRHHALQRMVNIGMIRPDDAAGAGGEPLPTVIHRDPPQPNDHFTEEVRRRLIEDPRLGASPAERSARLFRGGLRVETTVDPALQAQAEQAVREVLPPSPFTAALVAIDPTDGAVRALIGGTDFTASSYNLATQGSRQPGSSFKTIALAAWIADGRSPEDLVDATAPCEFPMPAPQPPWTVDNYDGGSGEPLVTTLREATVRSSNCAYARVALAMGPQKMVDMAARLGIRDPLEVVNSIVLGTGEVTPIEMASVYATLAADGVRSEPIFIRRVTGPDGEVLLENEPKTEQVLEPQVARTVTEVLRGVVDRGTGRRAGIGRPAAGKTGTSQEWRDAWFAGYTPQLAAAVWMGSPVGQESMADVGGSPVTGGSYPATIWSRFMGAAVGPLPAEDFAPPDPAAWPPSNWIGAPPAVLPPGFVLPPHLVPPPETPVPAEGLPSAETQATPPPPSSSPDPTTTTTTTTKRPPGRED